MNADEAEKIAKQAGRRFDAKEQGRYRKKPIVIDAHRWDGHLDVSPDWLRTRADVYVHDDCALSIQTLEGVMIAKVGDWIISGVKGELYPCKPDIFEATYERA